ncbi:MAG: polyprenol monophosphomannose synthase [Armatimonadota bacterium]|nr:polyprenol monophosphomannose synthase [Armatimonadota bacterium]MDR7588503.1 polyprenol monophosphomannose synthase [Armatimonadota bacterium]MDR7612031.1 polyprenol monophosphomannose synthase [Armatimonadota bacterium]
MTPPLPSSFFPLPSRDPELTVVVPTYNERESLPALVGRLVEVARGLPLEVVVVDDGSPDGTGALAEELARTLAVPLTVVHRPAKGGLASAVLEGARRARAALVAVMDADLSHPPELLPRLAAALRGGGDLAVASRYVPGGGVQRWPLLRRLISLTATWLARAALGLRVADPLSGYFVARREILAGRAYRGTGFKLLLEVLATHPDAVVVEVPYVFTDRRAGRSKLSPRELWEFLRVVIALRREGRWTVERLKR